MPVMTSQTTVFPVETKGSEELDQRAEIRQPKNIDRDSLLGILICALM